MRPRPVWAQTNLSYLCTLRIQRTAHGHAHRHAHGPLWPTWTQNPHITLSLMKKFTGSNNTWTAPDVGNTQLIEQIMESILKVMDKRVNHLNVDTQTDSLGVHQVMLTRLPQLYLCSIMIHLCLYNSCVLYPYQTSPFPWSTTFPHA